MKQRLLRLLSILCVLALATGCLMLTASASGYEEKEAWVITAVWDDENNYDGFRGPITAKVGTEECTLTEANGWTGEVSVPVGLNEAWTWSSVPAGYDKVSVAGTKTAVMTLKHTVDKTAEASGTVVWADNDNAAGLRPESVRIALKADGAVCKIKEDVTGGDVSWSGLYKYQPGTSTEIQYTVEALDEEVPGYKVKSENNTVTYTLKTGKLSVSAALSGAPDGTDYSKLKLIVTGPDPKTKDGLEITYGQLAGGSYDVGAVIPGAYVLQENGASDMVAEGYVMDPSRSQVGDAKYVEDGGSETLVFKYAWKETEKEEPNKEPLAEAGKLSFDIIGPNGFKQTVTFAQFDKTETGGTYKLGNLLPGEYAVIETNPEGLVRAYTLVSDSVTGMTLTVGKDGTVVLLNKYEPAPTPNPEGLVDIPVTKIWNDDNDKDGNRPASVTVNLFANGVLSETHVLTAAEGWAYTFLSKDQYDENGEEIVYTVTEEPVEWYTSEVNGTFITNTYKPEVTSASVVKVWDDKDNEGKIRPTSIAVTLLPTGEVYVLNEANGWSITVNNLATKLKGQPVTYSWREQEVVGYRNTGTSVTGSATVFTNRAPEIPKVPADQPQPKVPGGWVVFEEYETALGGELLINHVGDCFD